MGSVAVATRPPDALCVNAFPSNGSQRSPRRLPLPPTQDCLRVVPLLGGCAPQADLRASERVQSEKEREAESSPKFPCSEPRDCSETRSCPHHLQIELPPRRAQCQNLRLAPPISAGQRVHFGENAPGPALYLRPQKGDDVKGRAPSVLARWTIDLQLNIRQRVGLSHQLGNPANNLGRQLQ